MTTSTSKVTGFSSLINFSAVLLSSKSSVLFSSSYLKSELIVFGEGIKRIESFEKSKWSHHAPSTENDMQDYYHGDGRCNYECFGTY